jgi:hydroxypyruvate reductase
MIATASRRLLEDLFRTGLAACDPETTLGPRLDRLGAARPAILAVGKAARQMAAAALRRWPDAAGLLVLRRGEVDPGAPFETIFAGHPHPDEESLRAGAALLARAQSAGEGDHILFLLSGGASALAAAPVAGLTVGRKAEIAQALMRAGASVVELNTVRRHLSRIKGGRLAAAAFPARVTTFAVSDVVSDAPEAIGSGPTVGDPTTIAEARAVIEKYKTAASPVRFSESVKPGDPRLARADFAVVASARLAIDAIADEARRRGFEPINFGADLEGEARGVGAAHARRARELARSGRRAALISGGELTVTVVGAGRGGPNFEYAAALALGLEGAAEVAALVADSDGLDGDSGAAGAFVDGMSAKAARAAGSPLEDALARNDCATAFEAIGGAFAPGPTGSNLNDFRVILVGAA